MVPITTVNPDGVTEARISPGNGAVVRIASPIIVRFSSEPADRAAIEKRMTVVTSPVVVGSWA